VAVASTDAGPHGRADCHAWHAQLAEVFVYEYLRRSLGEATITPASWVSTSRRLVFPDDDHKGDDRAGYDFTFVDHQNRLGGATERGPLTYYVEVKGQLSPTKKSIYLTDNEWRTCRLVHERGPDEPPAVYVLVVVCLAPEPVRILYWLEDPYHLMNQGLVNVRPDRLAVVVNVPPLHTRGVDPATGADVLVPFHGVAPLPRQAMMAFNA